MRNPGVLEVVVEKEEEFSELFAFNNIQGLINYSVNSSARRQKRKCT
jgi:hypothetical protein